jgi:hypothetical protein
MSRFSKRLLVSFTVRALAGGLLAIALAAAAVAAAKKGVSEMKPELLFDVEIKVVPNMPAVVSSDGRIGEFVGSGDGRVTGPRLTGTLRFSLFEKVGDTACRMDTGAVLRTDDGAEIRIDAAGFALRRTQGEEMWITAQAVRFQTDDSRYTWLNHVAGLWAGSDDLRVGTARARVFAHGGRAK